jgi:hypothetical protein
MKHAEGRSGSPRQGGIRDRLRDGQRVTAAWHSSLRFSMSEGDQQ